MASLLTERSPEQRGQSDHADVRSADAVEDISATAGYQEGDCERAAQPAGRCPQNSPSTLRTTTITTIAPMMYRIEYIGYLFPQPPQRPLRTPRLGRGARCASVHYRWTLGGGRHITGGLSIPRVLWTQIQYYTWPCACHERFVTQACCPNGGPQRCYQARLGSGWGHAGARASE